jgi:hypothetical protein
MEIADNYEQLVELVRNVSRVVILREKEIGLYATSDSAKTGFKIWGTKAPDLENRYAWNQVREVKDVILKRVQ